MAFLAYYLHWGHDEVMNLDHRERRRWCAELSKINKRLNGKMYLKPERPFSDGL